MPFTPAHAALLFPLQKLRLKISVSAFVAGSFIPDFAGFLSMRSVGDFSHSARGILLFNIPAGLVFVYLFHALVREPLVRNLPDYYRSRMISCTAVNWRMYLLQNSQTVLLSLVAGIGSHLLWDGFTHENGVFVQWLPVLSDTIQTGGRQWPVYFLIQLLSSVAGLWLIHRRIHRLKKAPLVMMKREPYFWPGLFVLASGMLVLRYYYGNIHNTPLSLLKASIGALIYSLLLISVISKIIFKKMSTKNDNRFFRYSLSEIAKN